MNLQEINKTKAEILQLLEENSIYEALLKLKTLVDATADYLLGEQYEQQKMAYDLMLQYVVAGAKDTGRGKILQDIVQAIYTLTDRCVINLSSGQSLELFYTRAATMARTTVSDIIAQYDNLSKRYSMLSAVPASDRNDQALNHIKRSIEQVERDLFNKVWTQFPLTVQDTSAITEFLKRTQVPAHLKGLLISALLLGCIKFYDQAKLHLLLDAYMSAADADVQVRALSAAVIVMYQYRKRIAQSQQLRAKIEVVSSCPNFKSDIESITRRLIHSRNTENISKRMREDLMPNIMKVSPELLKKLRGKSGIIDPTDLEDNPEWADWLDKSGVTKKMEELQKLQFEGSDVFISTFSHLKSYPFFNSLANWFMPYHVHHSSLESLFGNDETRLLQVIESAPFLCDSDKFSFAFSMSSVPESQRKMMISQFDAQNADMSEMKAEELPDGDKQERDMMVNRYIQDLYRFFKLFSRKAEFQSIFDSSMDFLQLPFMQRVLDDKVNLGVIAEFYMKNGFYQDSIKYYHHMLDVHDDVSPQVLQKIGFAYQNLGQYAKAVDYYKRYDLVNDQDTWNLRHIATCYRALKDVDHALTYYLRAEQLAPDNASLCLNIGHCLLEQGKTEEALKYYFKVEYLAPSKHKAWRPIAWCSFALGNYEQSENYYKKIIDSGEDDAQDHLNYGHMLLCNGRADEAVAQYKQSLAASKGDKIHTFVESYNADCHYLLEHGLDRDYVALIREAVISQLFKK